MHLVSACFNSLSWKIAANRLQPIQIYNVCYSYICTHFKFIASSSVSFKHFSYYSNNFNTFHILLFFQLSNKLKLTRNNGKCRIIYAHNWLKNKLYLNTFRVDFEKAVLIIRYYNCFQTHKLTCCDFHFEWNRSRHFLLVNKTVYDCHLYQIRF